MPSGTYEIRYAGEAVDDLCGMRLFNRRQKAGGTAVKTVTWTENGSWDEVLRQAGEEDVIVLRDGHPFVLMTPFDDDDLAWYVLPNKAEMVRCPCAIGITIKSRTP